MSGNGSVHNVEPPNILKELLGLIQSLADGDDYNRSLERTYQLVNVDPNTFPSAFASALDYVFTLKEVRYKSFTETMIRYSVAVLTYVAAPSIDPVEAPVREQVSTALFTYFIERASSADKHTRKKACEVLKSVVTSAARDTELGAVIHELIRVASQRLQDADGSIRKDAYDLAWTLRQRLGRQQAKDLEDLLIRCILNEKDTDSLVEALRCAEGYLRLRKELLRFRNHPSAAVRAATITSLTHAVHQPSHAADLERSGLSVAIILSQALLDENKIVVTAAKSAVVTLHGQFGSLEALLTALRADTYPSECELIAGHALMANITCLDKPVFASVAQDIEGSLRNLLPATRVSEYVTETKVLFETQVKEAITALDRVSSTLSSDSINMASLNTELMKIDTEHFTAKDELVSISVARAMLWRLLVSAYNKHGLPGYRSDADVRMITSHFDRHEQFYLTTAKKKAIEAATSAGELPEGMEGDDNDDTSSGGIEVPDLTTLMIPTLGQLLSLLSSATEYRDQVVEQAESVSNAAVSESEAQQAIAQRKASVLDYSVELDVSLGQILGLFNVIENEEIPEEGFTVLFDMALDRPKETIPLVLSALRAGLGRHGLSAMDATALDDMITKTTKGYRASRNEDTKQLLLDSTQLDAFLGSVHTHLYLSMANFVQGHDDPSLSSNATSFATSGRNMISARRSVRQSSSSNNVNALANETARFRRALSDLRGSGDTLGSLVEIVHRLMIIYTDIFAHESAYAHRSEHILANFYDYIEGGRYPLASVWSTLPAKYRASLGRHAPLLIERGWTDSVIVRLTKSSPPSIGAALGEDADVSAASIRALTAYSLLDGLYATPEQNSSSSTSSSSASSYTTRLKGDALAHLLVLLDLADPQVPNSCLVRLASLEGICDIATAFNLFFPSTVRPSPALEPQEMERLLMTLIYYTASPLSLAEAHDRMEEAAVDNASSSEQVTTPWHVPGLGCTLSPSDTLDVRPHVYMRIREICTLGLCKLLSLDRLPRQSVSRIMSLLATFVAETEAQVLASMTETIPFGQGDEGKQSSPLLDTLAFTRISTAQQSSTAYLASEVRDFLRGYPCVSLILPEHLLGAVAATSWLKSVGEKGKDLWNKYNAESCKTKVVSIDDAKDTLLIPGQDPIILPPRYQRWPFSPSNDSLHLASQDHFALFLDGLAAVLASLSSLGADREPSVGINEGASRAIQWFVQDALVAVSELTAVHTTSPTCSLDGALSPVQKLVCELLMIAKAASSNASILHGVLRALGNRSGTITGSFAGATSVPSVASQLKRAPLVVPKPTDEEMKELVRKAQVSTAFVVYLLEDLRLHVEEHGLQFVEDELDRLVEEWQTLHTPEDIGTRAIATGQETTTAPKGKGRPRGKGKKGAVEEKGESPNASGQGGENVLVSEQEWMWISFTERVRMAELQHFFNNTLVLKGRVLPWLPRASHDGKLSPVPVREQAPRGRKGRAAAPMKEASLRGRRKVKDVEEEEEEEEQEEEEEDEEEEEEEVTDPEDEIEVEDEDEEEVEDAIEREEQEAEGDDVEAKMDESKDEGIIEKVPSHRGSKGKKPSKTTKGVITPSTQPESRSKAGRGRATSTPTTTTGTRGKRGGAKTDQVEEPALSTPSPSSGRGRGRGTAGKSAAREESSSGGGSTRATRATRRG